MREMFGFIVYGSSNLAGKVALYALIIVAIVVLILFLLSKTRLAKGIAQIFSALRAFVFRSKSKQDLEALDDIIEECGYKYDPRQDIFYSHLHAWQKKYGYCRLYDEMAAPLGMIIDCEPIQFEYKGKRWLIELWKGQYDLTTGCEIGIYTTDNPDLNIPGVFKGGFYDCANDQEQLLMAYKLKKNGKTLFTRGEKHWWLTGFKLGEFSEPSELTMIVKIVFKDLTMCHAFVQALKKLGYQNNEFRYGGNVVNLRFDKTHTPQPTTRVPETDKLIQQKNKLMCEEYQEITKAYRYLPDKMKAVKGQVPTMYKEALKIGKTRELFEVFETIKKYID